MKSHKIVVILMIICIIMYCNTTEKQKSFKLQSNKVLYGNKANLSREKQELKADIELTKILETKMEVYRFIGYKIGNKNEDIKTIQQWLDAYGFNVKADGAFGEVTFKYLRYFQRIFGLQSTGTVDKGTYDELSKEPTQEAMAKVNNFKTEYKSQNSAEAIVNSDGLMSMTDYMIYVDIPNQKVNILTGYEYHWQLIKSMSCASGRDETPTVKGIFSIQEKGEVFRPSSGVMCKYFSQFCGNYLFHSILLDNNGNVMDPTLGIQASHGCIRLAIENAKYIYTSIPVGTTVWIN